MMIVDSHCHASPHWYEPVESLLFQMDRHGVERAVLIQMNGESDNEYQFEVARRHPDRFLTVAWVDSDAADACDRLGRLADQGANGIRLSATALSRGSEKFAIWRTAANLGLPVSCGGAAKDFASREFSDLVREFPRLTIVLEHLGGYNTPGKDSPEQREHVFQLALFRNIYIKVHGLGEFCARRMPVVHPFPFETPIPPLLDLAYRAFGADRIMWGSDYPPVSAREGYGNALRLTLEQFASRSADDRALIFGQVALKVFAVR